MPHVVTERCIRCKFTECVDVCPVECFHEGPNMVVIDPMECIDCGVCVDVCPANAIYPENDVPETVSGWIAMNVEFASQWPLIVEPRDPLPDAEKWENVDGKLQYLER